MLKELREQVLEANLEVVRRGLVLYTFGNVSGISRKDGLVAIKPSGVPYERMTADDLVITDLEGKKAWGDLRPSSDLATHLHLYRSFQEIGGVVHTHSEFATSWAQAKRPIPPFGTTHADYFYGPIPVTRELTAEEIQDDYVHATGVAIVECFGNRDPLETPAALVADHGPFCWGRSPEDAVHNAVVLEAVARMATYTVGLKPKKTGVSQTLLDKHYFRKHGKTATYGQS
ncbi:L-ribulose-5-phosphate 4-epimerase [Microvirga rosea]|uniref:L-ribulose-5-phosphate 4-epimerase n=1 Tax=Microvirga rosea TaxID=2715425 RepID=UPI001D0B3C31|nr:L-ribulose-5-phosphate 4-epimerase [Microvirga rosea]MCB8821427.1 L-ribulose-5-phosphate 4-epimerase [Microvirga rosea]